MINKIFEIKERSFLFNGRSGDIFELDKKNANFIDRNSIDEKLRPKQRTLPKAMVLEVTEKCNLRCSYCIYGENYKHERTHSSKGADLQTLLDRINEFADDGLASIAFYGGEPLLELDLLKKIVFYAKNKGIFDFSLTTNGTLLSGDQLDFVLKNNINVIVSLDGPSYIHDKFRKFKNDNKGTHRVVMDNIKKIKNNYNDFFSHLSFNCVVCDFSFDNINDINNFFSNNLFGKNIVRFPLVQGASLNFADYYSCSDVYRALNSLDNRFLFFHFAPLVRQIIYRDPCFLVRCFPFSQRIYVRMNGDLQMCERLGSRFSRISKKDCIEYFFCKYKDFMSEECSDCWCKIFCPRCYAEMSGDSGCLNKANMDKYCKNFTRKMELAFEVFLYMMIENPSMADDFDTLKI